MDKVEEREFIQLETIGAIHRNTLSIRNLLNSIRLFRQPESIDFYEFSKKGVIRVIPYNPKSLILYRHQGMQIGKSMKKV